MQMAALRNSSFLRALKAFGPDLGLAVHALAGCLGKGGHSAPTRPEAHKPEAKVIGTEVF